MRALGLLFCGVLFIQCKGVSQSKSNPIIQEAVELQNDTLNTVEIQIEQESSAAHELEIERNIYGEDYLGVETAIGMYEMGGYYTEEQALQHLEKHHFSRRCWVSFPIQKVNSKPVLEK